MNISTNLAAISPAQNKPSGSYEWWYFDGTSNDGVHGFVIIFYHCNPFSTNQIKGLEKSEVQPGNYPAISISLYEDGKPIYYSFLEYSSEDFSWDEDSFLLKIGENFFRIMPDGEELTFQIELNQTLDSGHSLFGTIKGAGNLCSKELISSNESLEKHSWNLLLPQANIEARMSVKGTSIHEEIEFEGTGYFDHNTGFEPMKDSFKDWYWGRYHFKNSTLIYYLMNKEEGQQFETWLIDRKSQKVLETFTEVNPTYYSRNLFGLKSVRKFELSSAGTEITIQTSSLLDNGPFYQRFLGDAVMKRKGEVLAAKGISEYLSPGRIYAKKFWPLVHMRLRYKNEKPHWVQKSKRMYPWTW
ncbi:MAG: hypothetical protein WD016_06155 [Balneolaceae bacterium]